MDNAWCPVCDKQIEPKRTTLLVPRTAQPPPPPPSSPRKKGAPRKAGLVNGTGRLRPNGTVKPPSPAMKQRIVIDQGPTPLYCSDECQLVDLNRTRRGPPIDPHAEEPPSSPVKLAKKVFSTGSSDSDASSADGSPQRPMTSRERFNAFYNFPELTDADVPVFEEEPARDMNPPQYNSGIMMAGRLISSLAPPPAKPHVGRYRPVQEPRKPTPGWNDGSNLWRSTVYSFAAPSNSPFQADAVAKAYGSVVASPHRSHRMSRASSSATLPDPIPAERASSASEAMLSSFSEKFNKRSESRASLYAGGGSAISPVPSSAASTHSLPLPSPKHRSLVPSGAEGKLLVPDVKMKVHNGSSASLSSHWSGPTSSSTNSRRSASVRSPLSMTSDSDEDTERCPSKMSSRRDIKRPTAENTRSWSYENVKTYDIMPLIPKKVKKMEKRVIDGEEIEVEVEVEEYPERKRLFLFPPSQRISVP